MEAFFKKWSDEKGLSEGEREQVKRILDMAKIMVSKPLSTYLTEVTEYKMKHGSENDKPKFKKLLKMIKHLPVNNFTGYIHIPFKQENYQLHIQVCITDRKHEILLRDDKYLTPCLAEIDKMALMTCTYYQTLLQDEKLASAIKDAFGPNADKLSLNKLDRTMYIDDTYDRRLGILAFYADLDGKPIEFEPADDSEAGAEPGRIPT
jgi:hypothetical protein